jgi:competence ComEA-like helix-hairpin-helix protein
MAFFSFGKKDKNPPQAADSVAKAPPAPPKIQTPPVPEKIPEIKPPPTSGTMPGIRPPQPSGLIPSGGVIPNAATTQPMSIPRASGNLKAARPSTPPTPVPRSTQHLVLSNAAKTAVMKPMAPPPATGTINLPIGMILRCLPPEVLGADISQFENSGAAATEVALPMHAILSQLPSGRVEMPLQELVAHFPPGFLQPAETLAAYLPAVISLPLMDVVMRIPPHLLSLRPDQKDVDAAVANMADPFTEESIREQAEGARRAQGEANIVDESQVAPAEEFVPQAATPNRAFVPPARTASATSAKPLSIKPPSVPPPAPVLPAVDRGPTLPVRAPAAPAPVLENPATVRPPLLSASQSLSASQGVPTPRPPSFRAGSNPTIPGFFSAKSPTSSSPLSPGQSGLILPRLTETPVESKPEAIATPTVETPPSPATPQMPEPELALSENAPRSAPLLPDPNADDLQRLAALAMAQIGDEPEEISPAAEESAPETVTEPDASSAPTIPLKPDQVVAATARFKLPEFPARELSETTPVSPASERLPNRPELSRRGITAPVPLETLAESSKPETKDEPKPEPKAETKPVETISESKPEIATEATHAPDAATGAVAINLNSCAAEDLLPIPGVGKDLAEAIVQHRAKIGEFHKLEDLLDVPGMTGAVYSTLTGETVPMGVHQSLNELLGFPADQNVTLKDVTDRISCWPDVTGCLLSQNSGLVLVGNVPDHLDKQAIVAFAPRMFEELNKSFQEIAGRQTDDIVIPTTGTSFHILRDKDLYLTILCRVPQMPERHLKIARYVLAGLSVRPS